MPPGGTRGGGKVEAAPADVGDLAEGGGDQCAIEFGVVHPWMMGIRGGNVIPLSGVFRRVRTFSRPARGTAQ
jgi:hypothetical protein